MFCAETFPHVFGLTATSEADNFSLSNFSLQILSQYTALLRLSRKLGVLRVGQNICFWHMHLLWGHAHLRSFSLINKITNVHVGWSMREKYRLCREKHSSQTYLVNDTLCRVTCNCVQKLFRFLSNGSKCIQNDRYNHCIC